MFTKKHKSKGLISNLVAPKELQSTSCQHMQTSKTKQLVEPHFREMQITPTHVFEIYRRFTHTSIHDAIYHMYIEPITTLAQFKLRNSPNTWNVMVIYNFWKINIYDLVCQNRILFSYSKPRQKLKENIDRKLEKK